ncbi:FMN reductase [Okibacterium fritillariae]|uniref:FMN reductase n=1 Tax=Okibacterium fritillariae TaxID=123320 RepID=A0A1T5I846_9MICO|nr:FMN reductase [Okibacterium fritillariae]SKC35329.1 FMN reductase [Okibacterium fritillariae]
MTEKKIVVLSAGLSNPSSTRLLADRLADATVSRLAESGVEASVRVIELRDHALDVTKNLLTGFPSAELREALDALSAADGIVAVTPIFSTSYSGLFKSFIDILDREAIVGTPVLLGATGGTTRHSLAIDYAIRPLFTYLHAAPVSTGVFAASSDWGDGADTVADLPSRIARAAGELANAVIGPSPRTPQADPFALEMSFEDMLRAQGQ